MRPATNLNLSREARENISSISMRRSAGAFTNDKWTREHHEVLKAAASDPRVARIFVFPGAKVQMCKDEKGNRAYLRKIRPWWGHHYHFHVRLSCPPGADGLRQSGRARPRRWLCRGAGLGGPDPEPAAARSERAAAEPRRELVLADLPRQCAAVLQSP